MLKTYLSKEDSFFIVLCQKNMVEIKICVLCTKINTILKCKCVLFVITIWNDIITYRYNYNSKFN